MTQDNDWFGPHRVLIGSERPPELGRHPEALKEIRTHVLHTDLLSGGGIDRDRHWAWIRCAHQCLEGGLLAGELAVRIGAYRRSLNPATANWPVVAIDVPYPFREAAVCPLYDTERIGIAYGQRFQERRIYQCEQRSSKLAPPLI
jgi:hypothetical protein